MADSSSSSSSSSDDFDFALYRYTPSLPAAIVTTIIFAALTCLHTWRLARSRALYFTAFTIGGLFQTIGYAGRIWSHFSPTSIGGFVLQAILILVAPALYAASIYMILARLIRTLHATRLSPIPVRWLTRIFVTGDVVAFSLQAGGGGIQSGGTLQLYGIGEKIIVAGLFVQIVVFGVFVCVVGVFHGRMFLMAAGKGTERGGGEVQQQQQQQEGERVRRMVPWRRHLAVMYVASGLILVRSVFRVVEYLQGNGGYLISREVFLYVFDAVLMAWVMGVFGWWYVGDLESGKEKKGNKRRTERKTRVEEGSDVSLAERGSI